jgi:riboflavin kinase/FMN adenylyltransferase
MVVLEGEAARQQWDGPAAVVALGMFDGVHLGHQALVKRAVSDAAQLGGASIVLTFEPHPEAVVAPERAPQLLTLRQEKIALLQQLSPDAVIVYPFTPALAKMPAEEFVTGIIGEQLRSREIIVGYNFTFGSQGRGNSQLLSRMSESVGYRLKVIPPVTKGRHAVSSTAVRKALAAGDISLATTLLGHPYRVSGPVVHGAKRGRTMGFPTVNLEVPANKALPADGVYVAEITSDSVGRKTGVAAVSTQPTFAGRTRTLEAHLIDFAGDLYGTDVSVDFRSWIRGISDFGGPEELGERIAADVRCAREFFTR